MNEYELTQAKNYLIYLENHPEERDRLRDYEKIL